MEEKHGTGSSLSSSFSQEITISSRQQLFSHRRQARAPSDGSAAPSALLACSHVPNHHRSFLLGVCAMSNKVEGRPMQSILKRLRKSADFQIIQFSEELILHRSVAEWPKVDCLIAFHSTGYPLEKVGPMVAHALLLFLNVEFLLIPAICRGDLDPISGLIRIQSSLHFRQVQEYVNLVKPVTLNDVFTMKYIRSRIDIIRILQVTIC